MKRTEIYINEEENQRTNRFTRERKRERRWLFLLTDFHTNEYRGREVYDVAIKTNTKVCTDWGMFNTEIRNWHDFIPLMWAKVQIIEWCRDFLWQEKMKNWCVRQKVLVIATENLRGRCLDLIKTLYRLLYTKENLALRLKRRFVPTLDISHASFP